VYEIIAHIFLRFFPGGGSLGREAAVSTPERSAARQGRLDAAALRPLAHGTAAGDECHLKLQTLSEPIIVQPSAVRFNADPEAGTTIWQTLVSAYGRAITDG